MRRSCARTAAGLVTTCALMLVGASVAPTAAGAQPAEPAAGARYRLLHSFTGGAGGSWPSGNLAGDPNVALFGVTTEGGKGAESGNGTVFRLERKGPNAWRHAIIFDGFSQAKGLTPQSVVAVDENRLIGVTNAGGPNGAGTIFELRPGAEGKNWRHEIVHAFTGGADGTEVQALVRDATDGVIYGATSRGGDPDCGFGDGCGVIFALRPDAKTNGWSFEVIHSFAGGENGWRPWGPSLAVVKGVIYGTTHFGGNDCFDDSPYEFDCGTVYRLDPPKEAGAGWTKTVLYRFEGKQDGSQPSGTLVVRGGSIYSTTIAGGAVKRGTVFKVSAKPNKPAFSVIFPAQRNQYYVGGLTAGPDGVLYGAGETNKCASVFKLTPSPASETFTMTVLKRLKEANGCYPDKNHRFIAAENTIYGTTWEGGAAGAGTIYRVQDEEPAPPTQ